MPERPDLRQIATNIDEALDGIDRDGLRDILTFVFKEYVVEGPPPMLVHQAERIEDLEGLSFAELISALQTRLDLPELSLFQVDGSRVSVRAGGVMQPLQLTGNNTGELVPRPAPAAEPAPRPGVNIVETPVTRMPQPAGGQGASSRPAVDEAIARGRGDLVGGTRQAPTPNRGLSVRGRPGDASSAGAGGAQNRPPGGEQSARQSAAEPPQPPAESPKREIPDADETSTRFSLLELD